ncbi:MAG: hypothetical protein Tsb0021_00620 [Chlamydiales bacterium]
MRQEKALLVEEVKENIQKFGDSFIIFRYAGLTAAQATTLRKQIKKAGGECNVVKKRILNKAARSIGVNIDAKSFEGHIALAYPGEDTVLTTKVLYDFKKENESAIDILGANIEGKLCNAEQVKMISQLPSKDEMRAQLLATLAAPLTQSVAVMQAIVTSIIYCLDQNVSKSATSE